MEICLCMNCRYQFSDHIYYGYPLTCPECFRKVWPMHYSYFFPLNKDGQVQSQSYNQLVCYPDEFLQYQMHEFSRYQMMNSPIPVGYVNPYEQLPAMVEHNGQPQPMLALPPPPQPVPSYSNSSNGSLVHSHNSVEGSEAQSFVNNMSPTTLPGNKRATEITNNLSAILKGNVYISHPMARKLRDLIDCRLSSEDDQNKALNLCFQFGERVIFELTRDNQNFQDSPSNLLASIRSKGCQFLGLPMQDEILKLILEALEDGKNLTRKALVTFVLEKLEKHRPTSKKKIGDVVQLLYRACCFNITKQKEMSALMQLKENLRDYKALREQHDAQVVQIATDAGIRISTDNWALLLYNDVAFKPYMEGIIAKSKSKATFEEKVKQFEMFAQRRSNIDQLKPFCVHLKNLAKLSLVPPSGVSEIPIESIMSTMAKASTALDEVYKIVYQITENRHQLKSRERADYPEQQYSRNQNNKSHKNFCRDYTNNGKCPRGSTCKFYHSRPGYTYNRNIS